MKNKTLVFVVAILSVIVYGACLALTESFKGAHNGNVLR